MKKFSFYEYVNSSLLSVLCKNPEANAVIDGSSAGNNVKGMVKFYQTANGVLVYAVVTGFEESSGFHGFHIHEGGKCSGNIIDPFADVKSHYNLKNEYHPKHSGDIPPLLNSCGNALSVFLTDRFSVDEIIGKTVIIHENSDDFTTQPAGNSGKKLACGEIVTFNNQQ